MYLSQRDYIPAGCFGIPSNDLTLSDEAWSSISVGVWKRFWHQPSSIDELDQSQKYLSPNLQTELFGLKRLQPIWQLFVARWIELEFCALPEWNANVRVHILPDDVHRGLLDRTSHKLHKTRSRLLENLDYSSNSWDGLLTPTGDSLSGQQFMEQDEQLTLLQIFNMIPSPCPELNLVDDGYSQDAMSNLLESSVPGLLSNLHPYQRRSAAVMLQKEAQPGKILDPRLTIKKARDGSTWYADPVVGTVLSQPRYYDGVAGGILAEEMGSGKTIICLALILATRDLPTQPPDLYKGNNTSGGNKPQRQKMASLADMAASCATRNAVPWKPYFDVWKRQLGYEFGKCTEALRRNPGYYLRPPPKVRRTGRHPASDLQPTKMYLSSATIVVVPGNLLSQWKQEISKHTDNSLKVLILSKNDVLPTTTAELLDLDVILFSQARLEALVRLGDIGETPFASIHFKRCIVDEGHKLGNSKIGRRSNLLIGLDVMSFASRWIVTGTPSHGLFGIESANANATAHAVDAEQTVNESSAEMEKRDLERIGSIASLYLKAQPWSNLDNDRADWGAYLLLPKHRPQSRGSWDSLKSTMTALIIRHQLSEVSNLLPTVNEKIVILEGSHQDQLSLNIFSMMIIFNAVQSQRTDMDYFFHPRQRKSLLQIVHNLKQSSFFGGSFFTSSEISKSVETAEEFIKEGKVPVSEEDSRLLQHALELGRQAATDKLRDLSNQFHDLPVLVSGLSANAAHAWALDGRQDKGNTGEDIITTSASMMLALQRLLRNAAHEPESLNSLLNGGLVHEGLLEREKILTSQESERQKSPKKADSAATLAGNTKLGRDSHRKSRHQSNVVQPNKELLIDNLPAAMKEAKIVSTVSAKLSYLIDSVIRHQDQEKIIIFYENDNVAWYLASMLDMVSINRLVSNAALIVLFCLIQSSFRSNI